MKMRMLPMLRAKRVHPHRRPGIVHRQVVGPVERGEQAGRLMHSRPPMRGINPIYGRAFRTDRSVKFQQVAWATSEAWINRMWGESHVCLVKGRCCTRSGG